MMGQLRSCSTAESCFDIKGWRFDFTRMVLLLRLSFDGRGAYKVNAPDACRTRGFLGALSRRGLENELKPVSFRVSQTGLRDRAERLALQ